jgi:hypothetical protein
MSYYLKEGNFLWPTDEGAYDVRNELPVGTYTVGSSPARGFYLKEIDDFNITGKIYGKTTHHAERILNTFGLRPNSTGVLLNGEKGSGKTMLAKMISQKAAAMNMSTIVINTPFCGDNFNTFIQRINEPAVIVFDEFEKVFDNDQQEAILTLLDGVFPTKKLFILTVNDKYKVNSHMRNRPGRIFYMLDFKGLDAAFIEEYCLENLNNKAHIPQVCRLTLMFESFNFDMLKALVEEMNRYNESPNQAMEMLNAKPMDAGTAKHTVEIWKAGKKLEGSIHPNYIRGIPIAHEELEFQFEENPEAEDSDWTEVVIGPNHLKKIDAEAGTFTYVFEEGTPKMIVIKLTRENFAKSGYNWMDAI